MPVRLPWGIVGVRVRTWWTGDAWVDPDSFAQKTEQPAGRKRRAGGRLAVKRIPDGTVLPNGLPNQWDIPWKRALFISDGPDSTTSSNDILISGRPQDESGTEGLCSPSRQLEIAVVRLQKDIDDYRAELELTRTQTPAVAPRPPRWAGFTSTPVPRFSGKSNWEQYRHVFEAIVCSNDWDDVTAALQLLSHRDRDALNVALLVPESRHVHGAGIFDKVIIGSLQLPRATGRIQASVSAGV